MTTTLPDKVQRARLQLMLNQPYFASAIARLPVVDATSLGWCPTMATDGYYIYVNAKFCETLDEQEIGFVFAHELLHCVLGHIDRRKDRKPWLWNIAIDYATNALLVAAGMKMPKDGLYQSAFASMTAEAIYDKLTKDGGQVNVQGFDLHVAPGDMEGSSFRAEDFPSAEERQLLRQTLSEELRKQMQGTLPGMKSDELTAASTSQIPWERILARFINGVRKSDYRLFPFNRRHLWRGMYMPSLGVPGPQHLVVALDTSGSMDHSTLSRVLGELDALRSVTECRLTLVQCDAKVHSVKEFQPWEQTTAGAPNRYTIQGRGGTSFKPVFEWVNKHCDEQLNRPDALIYLTDGYGEFPAKRPEIPVLWGVPGHGAKFFPFGSVLRID